MNASAKPVLVVGGGMAGITAALEAAEVGCSVILVEKDACLGGRVVRMHRYFPKMCPPTCGFEINTRRIRQNPRIVVHTLSTVEEISGEEGDFKARIRVRPRYVTGDCSLDDSIAEGLSSERNDDFNYGMKRTKALYRPHAMAFPSTHVVDREALSDEDAQKLVAACPPGSIDLDMKEQLLEVEVGAVIVATGWKPYDAAKLDNLGYGTLPNVLTNVMMERLADDEGPTRGELVRPSDGEQAENVAFVQCAGSRDENHLPYCSSICCMASLKQARYVREKNANAKVTVFYIDIRTLGRLENFYYDMLGDENVSFVKGKVAKISAGTASGNLLLEVEDTLTRETLKEEFDLVVLATGMVPNTVDGIPLELERDEYGFLEGRTSVGGVYAAGCSKHPCDVSTAAKDSTAAAMRAIQSLRGRD